MLGKKKKKTTLNVSDSSNHRIQIFSSDGRWINTIRKQGSDAGCFSGPVGITIDNENGDVYVVDHNSHKIVVF